MQNEDIRSENRTRFGSLSDDSFEMVKIQTKRRFGEDFFERPMNDLELERLVEERYVPNGRAKEERVCLLRHALKEDVIRRNRKP